MNCWKEKWGIDFMKLQSIGAVIGINCILLALIFWVAHLIRKRQPLTASRLRREARKHIQVIEQPPFHGDFCRIYVILSALEGNIPNERLIAGLLAGWAAEEQILLCEMEKKRLKSFGDEQQATICFPGDEDHPFQPNASGAEGLLLGLLYGWADETATLQQSELYNFAREYHHAVTGRLEQFGTQGRHGLRAGGAIQPESKKKPIYTMRGVREAGQVLGYQQWLCTQKELPPGKWRDGILFGCQPAGEIPRLAMALAKSMVSGMNAGKHANEKASGR